MQDFCANLLIQGICPPELEDIQEALSDEDLFALWTPFPRQDPRIPHPQELALESEADILFYGGAAGGGKSDLLLGAALTRHINSIIFRRIGKDTDQLRTRSREIIGNYGRYVGGETATWYLPGSRTIQFAGLKDEAAKQRQQGHPHDLKGWDELPQFSKTQFTFVNGWNRTAVLGQRCRVLAAGNPPLDDTEGIWVIEYFAPWLDDQYPYPAEQGELRYFIEIEGKDEPFPDATPVRVRVGSTYKMIAPKSRTFIRSLVTDNPVYMATGYDSTLYNLPEPLRSLMAAGDFSAGRVPNVWQVIPREWVQAAMDRWPRRRPEVSLSCLGVDVARGGIDRTCLAPRYGNYIGELTTVPGYETFDGETAAAYVIQGMQPGAIAHIDVIGYGSSCYDWAKKSVRCAPINFSAHSARTDRTKRFKFRNQRAEAYWFMRECLDPHSGEEVALPPDKELLAELCAARYSIGVSGIQIEDKDEITARLGHSPDKADAVVMACMQTPPELAIVYDASTGRVSRKNTRVLGR